MRHRRARRTVMRSRARDRIRDRGRTKYAKGRENEAKVGRALEVLREQGFIDSYIVSTPNDEQDQKGIDAGLTTVQGVEIKFQIKSSERGVQKHMRKHMRKHPEIPCLNVWGCTFALDVALLIRTQFGLTQQSET